jgi:hypothetical protein
VTITSPGTVKTEKGMTTNLTLMLSESFDPYIIGAKIMVYQGYIDDGNIIITLTGGNVPICNPFVNNISCIADGLRVGFNITNIQPNNASRYSIEVEMKPFGDYVKDETAVLYIYRKLLI